MKSTYGVTSSQSESAEFVNIWLLLRRNMIPVAILVLAAVVLTSVYMRSVPDRYRTDAQMVLALSETRFSDSTGNLETFELSRSSVETELAKLRSRDFAEQVAETLDLFQDDSFVSGIDPETNLPVSEEMRRQAVTDKVLASYSVIREGESLALTVEGRSTDPDLAAAFANTVISEYIKNEFNNRVNRLQKSIGDLRRRVGLLGEEFTQAEARLAEFIRNDNLDDEQLSDRLRNTVERARTILEAGLEQQVPPEDEKAMREELADAEQRLQSRTRLELSLLAKERETELLRSRYQSAVDDLNLLETRIGQEDPGTTQVSVARVPLKAYAPSRLLAVLLAGAMSVIIGFVLSLVREGLDRTIKTEKQIFKMTGLQNLGYFVKQKVKPTKNQAAVAEPIENPNSPLAEAARGVLTNCIKFQDTKILLVTSALPNEGKSFLSSVLATTAAADGMDTLMIDLDTYRRGASKLLVPDSVKFQQTDLYSDNLVVQPVPMAQKATGTLDLMTVASPTRELTSAAEAKLKRVKETLSKQYDLIVIDTPPALVMDEVFRNDALVDAVLLVSRWGKTPQDALQTASRRLAQSGFHILGTVLNDVDPKKFRWIGYEGYYGHYDYYK